MLRGIIFTSVYYVLSVIYVLAALPTLLFPGRGATQFVIRSYTRAVRYALLAIAGISTDIRGKHRLPDGPFIIAAKHQSWGDGFLIYPEVHNLSFVTGDHLERFPLVGRILNKLGAIIIDTCGGGDRKAKSLAEGMVKARAEGVRVLVYPEGHLAAPGTHYRYKPGVWHMQKAMNVPVVPVATNLGLYWQQQKLAKTPGRAVVEFLEPIPPGFGKEAFIEKLSNTIEDRVLDLYRESREENAEPSILLPDPN
ncbi:1-acyl-sn-glycerol-3-phosphate acyltransferase [Henriciella sp. AS95]|uniref:lysophospholipid acyltransferase family protein n=1 Tax=Henriciella sp. AS95 TaxID=3135782 RepID=UPI0031716D35